MLQVRSYGISAAPIVIVLHGGPAAVGEAAPIARGLAPPFQVLEPWQRGSGGEPLTVARHVADLLELVQTRCSNSRPALVGESWGAMLALAYAAAHPQSTGPIVLIGCGTFDPISRAQMTETLEERIDSALGRQLDRLSAECPDASERLKRQIELTEPLYLFDPIVTDLTEEQTPRFDVRAHSETWADMIRLQAEGFYPSAFAAVESPVLMLHGAYDPHPGQMIRATLQRHLPKLEYREWANCGHKPWLEKAVREEFFMVLREWLTRHLITGESPCCDGHCSS
jgi:pimeloyl-ACP methyl ester carboxylesterase